MEPLGKWVSVCVFLFVWEWTKLFLAVVLGSGTVVFNLVKARLGF